MRLPMIVLACKADLETQVEPEYASSLFQQYRAGLVEVSVQSDSGRDKLKRSFDWLLKAVFRHRSSLLFLRYIDPRTEQVSLEAIDTINLPDHTYLNPASPDVLVSSSLPWEGSRAATPTIAQQLPLVPPSHHQSHSQSHHEPERLSIGTNFSNTSARVHGEGSQAPENHSDLAPLTGGTIASDDEQPNPPAFGNELEDATDRASQVPRQLAVKEKDRSYVFYMTLCYLYSFLTENLPNLPLLIHCWISFSSSQSVEMVREIISLSFGSRVEDCYYRSQFHFLFLAHLSPVLYAA
jgi:hypothetical protein